MSADGKSGLQLRSLIKKSGELEISLVNVPQAIIGSAVDYHFHSGFDGGLRFNYGSYTDEVRPDLTGKLRSYTAFFGRTW